MKHRSDYVEIPKPELEHQYYVEGLSQGQIAERFGVSPKTIGNRMAEYGLATRTAQDYLRLNLPKTELERLYVTENRPAPEVAANLGCAVSAVYSYLDLYDIPIRPRGADKVKRIVPDDRMMWSPEFAYAVGLVASDGNLQANVNEVRLASTDRQIIDLYCHCLGIRPHDIDASEWGNRSATPVHVRVERRPPYKEQYHIIFSDYVYRRRLEQIGLTPDKSCTLGPLQVPDPFFRDFLRGEFDGDGCWSVARRLKHSALLGIFTSGSPAYLGWLQEGIRRLAGIANGHIVRIDLRYQGESAEQLGQFMYYTPGVPCLARKHTKWQAWIAGPCR